MSILTSLDNLNPELPDPSSLLDQAIGSALTEGDPEYDEDRFALVRCLLKAYSYSRAAMGKATRILEGAEIQRFYTQVYEAATGQKDTYEWEWWPEELPQKEVPAAFVKRIALATASRDNAIKLGLQQLAAQENA